MQHRCGMDAGCMPHASREPRSIGAACMQVLLSGNRPATALAATVLHASTVCVMDVCSGVACMHAVFDAHCVLVTKVIQLLLKVLHSCCKFISLFHHCRHLPFTLLLHLPCAILVDLSCSWAGLSQLLQLPLKLLSAPRWWSARVWG